MLPWSHDFRKHSKSQPDLSSCTEMSRRWGPALRVPQRESQVPSFVGHCLPAHSAFPSHEVQTKQRRNRSGWRRSWRAAMDAVCAKVDAANRVTLPSFPVPSSCNLSLVLNLTSFGATLWQNRLLRILYLTAWWGWGWGFGPAWLGSWESCEEDQGWTQACREVWSQEKVAASLCGSVSLPLEKRLEKFLLGFASWGGSLLVKYGIVFSFLPSDIFCLPGEGPQVVCTGVAAAWFQGRSQWSSRDSEHLGGLFLGAAQLSHEPGEI